MAKAHHPLVLDLLSKNVPMTISQISEALGIPRTIIERVVRTLHRSPKQIRVAEWQEQRKQRTVWVAQYLVGKHTDVKKPPRLTGAEQSRRFRARHGVLTSRKRALAEGNTEVLASVNPFYGLVALATAPKYIAQRANDRKPAAKVGRPKKVSGIRTDAEN